MASQVLEDPGPTHSMDTRGWHLLTTPAGESGGLLALKPISSSASTGHSQLWGAGEARVALPICPLMSPHDQDRAGC